MENSLLYIKNQICENFIKENQNNFPFLVLNTEPNTLHKMSGRVSRANEAFLKKKKKRS